MTDLLQIFRTSRKPECPLCGSSQWLAAEVVTVDLKDLGGLCQRIAARSPCGHAMTFTESTIRKAAPEDRKLLRRCA
ncbi:MAG: hypothetical protein J0H62_08200 [Rhizobiales bacterium]|nr:hypothetical protein [Hyphomicrobiales bacterium]